MGQGEEASVGGIWGAGLVEKVWVEPEAAARREGGGVRAGAESGLLDDQLTVLQVRTIRVKAELRHCVHPSHDQSSVIP